MSVVDAPSLTRSERRKQHTRDLLQQACADLLNERGYEALTIQAITDRADLGYGTFYLHFKDKDEIVWSVIHGYADAFSAQVDARLVDVPFPRREYLSWVAIFEYVDQVREGFVAMFGARGSAVLYRYYQDYLARLHEDNIRDEKYTTLVDLPPEVLAQFMTGALMRLLIWWAETPNGYTAAQMAAMLFQVVYRQEPPTA